MIQPGESLTHEQALARLDEFRYTPGPGTLSDVCVVVSEDDSSAGEIYVNAARFAGATVVGPFVTASDTTAQLTPEFVSEQQAAGRQVVLIQDLRLRDGSGVEVLDRLTQLGLLERLGVVFSSASHEDPSLRSYKTGDRLRDAAVAEVGKPFRVPDLQARIARVAYSSRLRQQVSESKS